MKRAKPTTLDGLLDIYVGNCGTDTCNAARAAYTKGLEGFTLQQAERVMNVADYVGQPRTLADVESLIVRAKVRR